MHSKLISIENYKMEESVATRLKLFIQTTGITSTQFADECGIPRPTLSQILSGRNKKISDILVGQIHRAFPELSIMWLLFGEGPVKVSHASGSSDHAPGFIGSSEDEPSEVSAAADFEEEAPYGGIFMSSSGYSDAGEGAKLQNSRGEAKEGAKFSNVRALKRPQMNDNLSKNEVFESDLKIMDLKRQIEQMRQNPRKVVQITIYYDDSTFETFVPK